MQTSKRNQEINQFMLHDLPFLLFMNKNPAPENVSKKTLCLPHQSGAGFLSMQQFPPVASLSCSSCSASNADSSMVSDWGLENLIDFMWFIRDKI